jgi:hypothetical protein
MDAMFAQRLRVLCGRPRRRQALFALPEPVPSVPPEAHWQFDRLELFGITAQLQHGIERFRRRTVCEAGGQILASLLKSAQQARQRLNCIRPLLWSTAPIGRAAVSDKHRRTSVQPRRSPCAAPDRLPIVRRGSRRDRRGWWSWHPILISRDASRVLWISIHHQLGVPTAVCRPGGGDRPLVLSKQLGVPS